MVGLALHTVNLLRVGEYVKCFPHLICLICKKIFQPCLLWILWVFCVVIDNLTIECDQLPKHITDVLNDIPFRCCHFYSYATLSLVGSLISIYISDLSRAAKVPLHTCAQLPHTDVKV